MAHRRVRHDPVQPGLELGVPPKSGQPAEDAQVRLLSHVLGVLPVSDQAERLRVHPGVGCAYDLLEGFLVAPTASREDLGTHHGDGRLDSLTER